MIHPSNEIITSDVVQRWALIGQLLFIAKVVVVVGCGAHPLTFLPNYTGQPKNQR